jgi:hypothetical protein
MVNAAAPYRRENRHAVRVPIVLPSIEVTVDHAGDLTITLDRQPYSAPGDLQRGDLELVLNEIAADLGTPVRVQVHEADGSVFTDILTPPRATPDVDDVATRTPDPTAAVPKTPVLVAPVPAGDVSGVGASNVELRALHISAFGVSGEGFAAGEQVEVCVVVARHVTDDDGAARLRLPPALLADLQGLMLVGRTSGTVALSNIAGEGAA